MTGITIYTSPLCGYCHMAKRLLKQKNAAYTEINVLGDRTAKAEMIQRANGRTSVPQIFFGESHIGGCDDLHALEQQGRLDALLAEAA